ncbi:MAG: hypothetical protein JST39_02755, partial [Bacteroidetes bacterium]|nr:hypothetical protein [Bacteroidota bacterium]
MKRLLTILSILASGTLHAQYVYTINADSVKITNHCDTAELIIENHTQNIPGFLFNKGRGRTEFRRAFQKVSDTLYVFGSDSLRLPPGITLPNKRIAFGSSANTIASATTLTYDSISQILTVGPGHLSTGGSNIIFSYNLPVGATGAGNVAIGMHGLFQPLTTGGQNIAIGDYTMTGVTSGSGNTAVGPGALQRLTTGGRNVAYGYQSLQYLSTTN